MIFSTLEVWRRQEHQRNASAAIRSLATERKDDPKLINIGTKIQAGEAKFNQEKVNEVLTFPSSHFYWGIKTIISRRT